MMSILLSVLSCRASAPVYSAQFSIIPHLTTLPQGSKNDRNLQPQDVSERLHVVNVSLGTVCFALLPLETELYEPSGLTTVKVESDPCDGDDLILITNHGLHYRTE